MHADPDGSTTDSRGPWADEGQYTIHARNFIQQGDWTMDASDALLKTPLFSLMQYIGFSVTGVSLFYSRLFVLLFVLTSLLIGMHLGGYFSKATLWMIPLAFSHWLVFQYAHYSLAELPAIACVWLAFGFYLKSEEVDDAMNKYLFICWVLLLSAVFFKMQFVYVLLIIPCYSLLHLIVSPSGIARSLLMRRLAYYLVFVTIAVSLLWLFWLKPNSTIMSSVMRSQVEGRFIPLSRLNVSGFLFELFHNIRALFFGDYVLSLFSSLYLVASLLGAWLIQSKKSARLFHVLFLLLLSWQCIELHKLFLLHAPARYLVSVYFPMTCLLSLVTFELITMHVAKRIQVLAVLASASVLCLQLVFVAQALHRRTFQMISLNSYVKRSEIKSAVVIGQWAPAVTWQVDALTLPYIEGLTDKLKKDPPCRLIVSEVGQEAELREMLNLLPAATSIDSTSYQQLGAWRLRFTWLR